jgi:hypothetical protein
MYLLAPPTIPAYQVLQRNCPYVPLVLKKKKGVNVGHPQHKNLVSGSIVCRHDRGMSANCADIWLSSRHVADMSAILPAKTMVNGILLSLKSKVYQGDRKNFNFNKYCLAHVEQHNHHALLIEYGVHALEESMKIHYFEEGIKDPRLDAARNAILVNRMQFPNFDIVMQLYISSKCSQKSEAVVPQGRNLSTTTGCGGGRQGRGGKNTANVFKFAAAVSSVKLEIYALTDATTKRTAAKEDEDPPDPWVNPNRENPALVCQSKKSKSNN